MSAKEIRKRIRRYIHALRMDKIKVRKAVLFGSYAINRTRKDSDIDLAIFADKFARDRIEAGQLLMRKAAIVDPMIEPHAFLPEDYNDTLSPLIHEIRTHGVKIRIQKFSKAESAR